MADVYRIVTDRIVELLEAGTAPWRKPWAAPGGAGEPISLSTGRPYRGVNRFLLGAACYASPYWLTFRQALARGGCVRRGEHGTPVVLWKVNTVERENSDTGETERRTRFLLRYFTVFNVEQCDGLQRVPEPEPTEPGRVHEPIAACERIVSAMPSRPTIGHGGGAAYYRPATDGVRMPEPETFVSPEAYYGVLFHELTHSTGHATRLGRHDLDAYAFHRFGDANYSREELVAEMGSAFLCATAGIVTPSIESNSAAYLASWIRALRGDVRLVVTAAAQAQRAADFIVGRTYEDDDA